MRKIFAWVDKNYSSVIIFLVFVFGLVAVALCSYPINYLFGE